MLLKQLREANDIEQKDLAKLLNVGQNTYSRYETGARCIPLGDLITLANLYQVSLDEICERKWTNIEFKGMIKKK